MNIRLKNGGYFWTVWETMDSWWNILHLDVSCRFGRCCQYVFQTVYSTLEAYSSAQNTVAVYCWPSSQHSSTWLRTSMWLKARHFYTSGDKKMGPKVQLIVGPFQNSVSTSQRVPSVFITKVNLLRLLMEVIVVYYRKHKKHTSITIVVIWCVTSCSFFGRYQGFGWICFLHFHGWSSQVQE
jgi:hypothetical protein